MSYEVTKLSGDDKDILGEIYDELEKIILPKRYQKTECKQGHAKRTGACNQKNARQVCFGMTKHRGKKKVSKFTEKYPHIMDLFNEFIDNHIGGFHFDGVYVNRNLICKKHLDSKNVGKSLIVGFGDFTEGETSLYFDKEIRFNIQNYSLSFNGSKIEHSSLPFKGTRYSLVFFTVSLKNQ